MEVSGALNAEILFMVSGKGGRNAFIFSGWSKVDGHGQRPRENLGTSPGYPIFGNLLQALKFFVPDRAGQLTGVAFLVTGCG